MERRLKMIAQREKKGWTQDALAFKVKCSRGLISNIERGYATPSLPLAISISRSLESSVEDIFFDRNAQKVSRKGRKKIEKGEVANEKEATRTVLHETLPNTEQNALSN